MQINILVGTIIASFEASAVSYLYYADRIYQINLAIAGIAVGTVSLPVLSKAFKQKNFLKISNIQSRSNEKNFLLIKNYLPRNILKIILSTVFMSFLLIFALDHYADYLDYNYKYKSVYLLIIVGFVGSIYLVSCYLTGILKTKNFKTN